MALAFLQVQSPQAIWTLITNWISKDVQIRVLLLKASGGDNVCLLILMDLVQDLLQGVAVEERALGVGLGRLFVVLLQCRVFVFQGGGHVVLAWLP